LKHYLLSQYVFISLSTPCLHLKHKYKYYYSTPVTREDMVAAFIRCYSWLNTIVTAHYFLLVFHRP